LPIYGTQFLHVHPASSQMQQRPYKADGFTRGKSHLKPTKRHVHDTSIAIVRDYARVRLMYMHKNAKTISFFLSLPNLTNLFVDHQFQRFFFHRKIKIIVKSKASYSLSSWSISILNMKECAFLCIVEFFRISYFLIFVRISFCMCLSFNYISIWSFEVSIFFCFASMKRSKFLCEILCIFNKIFKENQFICLLNNY